MAEIPDLAISPEKVAAILLKARQFDVKDVVTDPDSASNGSDDAMLSVLEDHASDPARTELSAMIRGLNVDEQVDLVALAWLGRGDGDIGDWHEIRSEADRAHNRRTAQYLMGIPLLSDYLEDALAQFGEGDATFLLQDAQDVAVDLVQFAAALMLGSHGMDSEVEQRALGECRQYSRLCREYHWQPLNFPRRTASL